jgi:DNA-binding NarL/FixJ family response regulator
MPMMPVQILIADDHDVVRQGLRRVLEAEPRWVVCGEAATGREAVALAVALQPEVVLLDISMPGLNGIDATRRIRRLVPSTRVIILTMHNAEQIVTEALGAGARGCVLKSDSARTLVTAIQRVLANQTYISAALRIGQGEGALGNASAERTQRLTGREREVLQLLTEGRGNKEIAALLGISPKTAETHRGRVMNKLGLHSVGELVRYAIRNRIIEP